ncbi:hypothetical protein ES705_16326 [subsurface metagenome]
MKLEGEDLFVLFRVYKFASKNVSKVESKYINSRLSENCILKTYISSNVKRILSVNI